MTIASYSAHLSNGDGLAVAKSYKASHPDLFQVEFAAGSYNSHLVALQNFAKGQRIAAIKGTTPSDEIRYSTVQVSEKRHIELNSDLLYCNHSCDPSVRFDVSGPISTWAAIAEHDIKKGDILTFFYPSTEWDMSQPFECTCGTARCLKLISGALHIPASTLSAYFLNAHIVRCKAAQLRSADDDLVDAAPPGVDGKPVEIEGEQAARDLEERNSDVLSRSRD